MNIYRIGRACTMASLNFVKSTISFDVTYIDRHRACRTTPCMSNDTMHVERHHACRTTPCMSNDTVHVERHHACRTTPCMSNDIVYAVRHAACRKMTISIADNNLCERRQVMYRETYTSTDMLRALIDGR